MESLTLQFCVKEIENKDVFEVFFIRQSLKEFKRHNCQGIKKKGLCVI